MKFLYGPDEKPPFSVSLPAGMQWAVISVAYILSFAMLIENIQGGNGAVTVAFIQKVLLITAAALVLQIFAGHRLPLVFGPSAALLIGISSSTGFTEGVIYGSMAVAAAAGVLIASTGLLAYISRLFTYRVITVVLLLISFTLILVITPMFISSGGGSGSLYTLTFGLAVLAVMYLAQRFGGRIIRATLFLWVLIPGTLIYSLIFAYNPAEITHYGLSGIATGFPTGLTVEPGVLISFLICYLAVIVNDIGSIRSIAEVIEERSMQGRYKRGIIATGIANIASGLFGVIGGVNYSISAGMILETRCASKWTLVPAAIIMAAIAFLPDLVALMTLVPSVIIGAVLIYVLAAQFSAALYVFFKETTGREFEYESGIIVGLPVIIGTMISFIPSETAEAFPPVIRPIIANGFVMGVIGVMLLEHVIFRKKKEPVS
ncbi:uracil-xanthine permease family protein [Methanolacinia petrolearia]|uniref:uracil-xanthine permease family protein n=1 Tax=Methanolacinia petrolearia TaxID=54120 RepID=UPI003BAC0F70